MILNINFINKIDKISKKLLEIVQDDQILNEKDNIPVQLLKVEFKVPSTNCFYIISNFFLKIY
jgi:hypothetical protein